MEKGTKLLEGSIWKGVVAFAIPLFLGNLFQQLYNTVDSLIVGNFLGSDALAAVSSSGSLIFLLVGFFNGIAVGAGVVISKYFGARDYENLKKAVHTDVAFGLDVYKRQEDMQAQINAIRTQLDTITADLTALENNADTSMETVRNLSNKIVTEIANCQKAVDGLRNDCLLYTSVASCQKELIVMLDVKSLVSQEEQAAIRKMISDNTI